MLISKESSRDGSGKIMLTAEGQAKLADLGMAKTFGEDFDLTRSTYWAWASKFYGEQFRDAKRVDVRWRRFTV